MSTFCEHFNELTIQLSTSGLVGILKAFCVLYKSYRVI